MSECSICIKAFTDKVRKEIKCIKCEYSCCKLCLQQYCLSKVFPQCMNCNQIFDDLYCLHIFGKTMTEKINKNKFESLFQQELSLIPETIKKIQKDKRKKEYEKIQNIIVEKTFQLTGVEHHYEKIENNFFTSLILSGELKECPERIKIKYSNEINQYTQQLKNQNLSQRTKEKLQKEIIVATYIINCSDDVPEQVKRHNKNRINVLQEELDKTKRQIQQIKDCITMNSLKLDSLKDEDFSFRPHLKCINSDCRGYLDLLYCCMLCNLKVCNHCHEELNSNHTCNPETVKTIKAIQKESRPCPSCGIRISKQSGCNQMFCINCNTAFNWVTGEIEKGRIHNPHYFEWRNRRGQIEEEKTNETIDINCFEINQLSRVFHNMIIEVKEHFKEYNLSTLSHCFQLLRLSIHLSDTYGITEEQQNPVTRFENLRRRYINKEWNEEQLKTNLYSHVRKYDERMKRYLLIDCFYNVVVDTCKSILMSFKNYKLQIDILEEKYKSICNFIEYFNKESLSISNFYNFSNFLYINTKSSKEEWKSCTDNTIIDDKTIEKAIAHLSIETWMTDIEKNWIEKGRYFKETYPPTVNRLIECNDFLEDCKINIKKYKQKKERIEFFRSFVTNFYKIHMYKNTNNHNYICTYDSPDRDRIKAPYIYFITLFDVSKIREYSNKKWLDIEETITYNNFEGKTLNLTIKEGLFLGIKWIKDCYLNTFFDYLTVCYMFSSSISDEVLNILSNIITRLKNSQDNKKLRFANLFF